MAYEFNGTIRIIATQSFESDQLIKNIARDLVERFPGTVLSDKEHHEFDEFHLKSLKKINAWLFKSFADIFPVDSFIPVKEFFIVF